MISLLVEALSFVGNNKWYSKRQETVETSTCGSDQEAMRIALELYLICAIHWEWWISKEKRTINKSITKNTPNYRQATWRRNTEVVAYQMQRDGAVQPDHSDEPWIKSYRLKNTMGPAGCPSIWMNFYFGRNNMNDAWKHYGFHPSRGVVEINKNHAYKGSG
jgi:hypothetical protein